MTFERHTFDHIGIPTTERHTGEVYIESTQAWITSPRDHVANVEWLRYEPKTNVPDPVRFTPHVAYRVEDIDNALEGQKIIMDPFEIGAGFAKVAFINLDGAVVEFMQYRDPSSEGWI